MKKIITTMAIVVAAVVNCVKNCFAVIVNAVVNFVKNCLAVIVNAFKNPRTQRVALAGVAFFLIGVCPALAQDGISSGLQEIATKFQTYVDPVQKIVYAIAAICAVVGAFTIYFKMTNGDQDVKKTIMLTVGGVAGLVVLASQLPNILKSAGS